MLDLIKFSIVSGYPLNQNDYEDAVDLIEAWNVIATEDNVRKFFHKLGSEFGLNTDFIENYVEQ